MCKRILHAQNCNALKVVIKTKTNIVLSGIGNKLKEHKIRVQIVKITLFVTLSKNIQLCTNHSALSNS